jgi:hypothetical protein
VAAKVVKAQIVDRSGNGDRVPPSSAASLPKGKKCVVQ